MHYKNGRLAQEGDPVVYKKWNGKIAVGTLHTISPGSTSCNASVAQVAPGGVIHDCVTIGSLFHAEDAHNGAESLLPQMAAAKPAPEAATADNGSSAAPATA